MFVAAPRRREAGGRWSPCGGSRRQRCLLRGSWNRFRWWWNAGRRPRAPHSADGHGLGEPSALAPESHRSLAVPRRRQHRRARRP